MPARSGCRPGWWGCTPGWWESRAVGRAGGAVGL
ncbi:unnamed protein product [Ectocarpus sp. CCAP 1310/34]|nr:unnamed protein product [Ectocarpus sp. CCAP 1310/34]